MQINKNHYRMALILRKPKTRKPINNGSQSDNDLKAKTVTTALSKGIPSGASTSGTMPSAIPMPWGVGDTIAKRIPMAYPAISVP